MAPSLRARLLGWLLLPLAAFVVITGAISYDAARQTANLVQDSALLSSARTIVEDVDWDNSGLSAVIPPAALEIFESPYRDQVFYKVIANDTRLLVGNPQLPVPSRLDSSPVFYDTGLDGQTVRAVAFPRLLYDAGKVDRVIVVVAKTQGSREAMISQLWHPQLIRQCLMLALVAALVPLGLTIELRPLMKLKDDVADREPMQLEPIGADHLPFELRPIVDAINQCIARLKLHATTQRQFIADAAHQLRTPLTLLDTQIQYACGRDHGDASLEEALVAIRRSSRKMTEMTNQLLLLAQAESASPPCTQARIDMTAVVLSALEELIVAAEQRGIDLGAELDDSVPVMGSANLLSAMVMNLLDNAVRYSHDGGRVTAICRRDGDGMELRIADNGPGIPAELRAHVFERFYRGSTEVEGTGLGLSIVREIAHLHGGTVTISPGENRVGLVVTVRMQVANQT
ncbi:sensor histidine kinase N-terminal domain-containing protein (plasmid) [Paraburkholderia sp. D15]|uniref:sensor histidine kinase n=1 Tax=Paraburkholderia sp. D15 TaxID=2880218 RepID=UPI002478EA82|nr:sensor histidine kinase [Paraburkholderia sp. D15]WGS54908.1 sensor histidine kinase N-terminal domain-containing protein [Paraburkholderia sp. D15]